MIALNQNLAHMKISSSSTFVKYKCCVSNSSDLSRDHFAKICKLLTNWWPVFSKSGKRILYLVHVLYPVRSPWTAVRSPQSMFYTAWFCIRRSPKYPCRVLFAITWLQHKDNAIWFMLIWCMPSSPPKSCTWVVLAHLCIEDRKVKRLVIPALAWARAAT